MTTETHPIALPTEPGLYEAKAFPVAEYLPIRVYPDGKVAEVHEATEEGETAYTIALIGFEQYAKSYGPFRRIDEEPEPESTPPAKPAATRKSRKVATVETTTAVAEEVAA